MRVFEIFSSLWLLSVCLWALCYIAFLMKIAVKLYKEEWLSSMFSLYVFWISVMLLIILSCSWLAITMIID